MQDQFEVITRARHLKHIFFIDESFYGSSLINLFHVNIDKWGGRLNPIIPVVRGEINSNWIKLADQYDPDFIHYSKNLNVDQVKKWCCQLKFVPVSINEISEDIREIAGYDSLHLLKLYPKTVNIVETDSIDYNKNILVNFYQLNYGLNIRTGIKETAFVKEYQVLNVDLNNIENVNEIFFNETIAHKVDLSALNVQSPKLKYADNIFSKNVFEIVITTDYNNQNDLLYFWNKKLFTFSDYYYKTIIITMQQLESLLSSNFFINYLSNLRYIVCYITSYSLQENHLREIRDQISLTINKEVFINFSPNFPYEIEYVDSYNPAEIIEKGNTQYVDISFDNIQLPTLTFDLNLDSNYGAWGVELSILTNSQKLDNFTKYSNVKSSLRLSRYFNAKYLSNHTIRVNRKRELSIIIKNSAVKYRFDRALITNIDFPDLYNMIRIMLTQPNFLGEDILSPFSNCSLTDAGLKLRGFNKLFSNDLNYIEELVFDKFWIDTFYSLSTNVRVEGDTFTFKDLVHRLRIAWSSYKNNTNVKDVDYFIEKASSNVKLILQDFINEKILLIGYNLKCKQCSSKFWYSLDEIKHTHICKGCSNENFFDIEAPLSYKLNHLIKNNLAHTDEQGKVRPDGNFLIIKTIIDLYNGANNSFRFLPPLNIYKKVHPKIQYTDLDIICLVDGALIIGEAKMIVDGFKKTIQNV